MDNVKLRIGFGHYDRHRGSVDGSIQIRGVNAECKTRQIITEIFEGVVRQHIYDVGELGRSYCA
jgi:hypothetical protein